MRKIIIIIVSVLLVASLALLGFGLLLNKKKPEEPKPKKYTNDLPINYVEPTETTFEYKGKRYIRKSGYNIDFDSNSNDDTLHLFNYQNNWGAYILLLDSKNFDDAFDDFKNLEARLKSQGNKIDNMQVLKHNDEEYVMFDLRNEGNLGILAYIHAYDDYYYEITLYGKEDEVDYNNILDVLEVLDTRQD